MSSLHPTSRWLRRLAPIGAFLFVVACGDAHTFKLSPGDWEPTDQRGSLSDLNGALVELARVSSRCNVDARDSLLALVGSHMEFAGEDVTGMKSPCAGGPEVRVDIDLGGNHILYDFSKVSEGGRFPDAEFEGFVITDMYHSVSDIRAVAVDRNMSTMLIPNRAVSFDAHSVSINLAGIRFDPSSFVKLDLVFESEPDESSR